MIPWKIEDDGDLLEFEVDGEYIVATTCDYTLIYLTREQAKSLSDWLTQASGANFSKKIKRLRKERGMTQGELALTVGCSVSTVNNWEGGRNGASPAQLKRIADFFGVAVNELLNEKEENDYKIR